MHLQHGIYLDPNPQQLKLLMNLSFFSLESIHNETYRICERLDGVKAHEFVQDRLAIFSEKGLNYDESLHNFDMYYLLQVEN